MPTRPILLLGSPTLWTPSAPVEDVTDRATQETIADLAATLAAFRARSGFGRGIAAPQLGVLSRVIFLHVGRPIALVNPVVTWTSDDDFELWDDCFSFPELLVRVRRKTAVRVRYLDEHGASRELAADDRALAELLQHELDHLDGVLATDRAIHPRAFALRAAVRAPA